MYAYLVENKWHKGMQQSRQKKQKYLGRVHSLQKIQSNNFSKDLNQEIKKYCNSKTTKQILCDLVIFELINHNFTLKEKVLEQGNFIVDLKKSQVYEKQTQKPICLELNNNFLTNETLRPLINYNLPINKTQRQITHHLANILVSAGIQPDKEVFIELSKKVLNSLNNPSSK